jgi:hypothetical protein
MLKYLLQIVIAVDDLEVVADLQRSQQRTVLHGLVVSHGIEQLQHIPVLLFVLQPDNRRQPQNIRDGLLTHTVLHVGQFVQFEYARKIGRVGLVDVVVEDVVVEQLEILLRLRTPLPTEEQGDLLLEVVHYDVILHLRRLLQLVVATTHHSVGQIEDEGLGLGRNPNEVGPVVVHVQSDRLDAALPPDLHLNPKHKVVQELPLHLEISIDQSLQHRHAQPLHPTRISSLALHRVTPRTDRVEPICKQPILQSVETVQILSQHIPYLNNYQIKATDIYHFSMHPHNRINFITHAGTHTAPP